MASENGKAKARAEWVTKLETAVRPRVGTEDQRRAFAEAVVTRLAGAYTRGRRSETAYNSTVKLLRSLWRMREAIPELGAEIEADPVFAQQFGLTPHKYRRSYTSFLDYIDRAIIAMQRRNWRVVKPRRGRKSATAVVITEMVATEYYRHFGKRPGISKQSDANNPFTRVCGVVERILESTGHSEVLLGYIARRAGIDQAGTVALCELLELRPDDVLVVANPWERLEEEKKRRLSATEIENELEALTPNAPRVGGSDHYVG